MGLKVLLTGLTLVHLATKVDARYGAMSTIGVALMVVGCVMMWLNV